MRRSSSSSTTSRSRWLAAVACVLACVFATPTRVDARENCDGHNLTQFKRLADLRAVESPTLTGSFCVTQLSTKGVRGCSTLSESVSGELERLDPAGGDAPIELEGERVLLTTPGAWQRLMRQAFAKNDERSKELRTKVLGVLIEATDLSSELEREWAKGFAPGPAHESGKAGGFNGGVDAGSMDLRGVPMLLLDEDSTRIARKKALDNAKRREEGSGQIWRAEINERMSALGLKPRTDPPSSIKCLEAGTCLPIGGYSVVASVPPLKNANDGKDVILVVTRLDSDGFFRDSTPAVNHRMSGLITMLSVSRALKHFFQGLSDDEYGHPVAFMALSGEDFGKLGSDRIMREWVAKEASRLPGLAGRKVRAMIELGPLGFAPSYVGDAAPTLYVHGRHATRMLDRLEAIPSTFDYKVTVDRGVQEVSESSESTFEHLQSPSYEYAYISENPDGPLDEMSGTHLDAGIHRALNKERIENAVHVIANLVRSMTTEDTQASAPPTDMHAVKSTVFALEQCLGNEEVGLRRCPLGKQFVYGHEEHPGLTPREAPFTRYPNVLTHLSDNWAQHSDKNDLARFVWNYMADATSMTMSPRMCEADGKCATSGYVCVGRTDGDTGLCHESSPRYILALSTRLSFSEQDMKWKVRAPKDAVEVGAPLWTESNWSPTIGARLFVDDDGWNVTLWAMATIGALLAVLTFQQCAVRRTTKATKTKSSSKASSAKASGQGGERERLLG